MPAKKQATGSTAKVNNVSNAAVQAKTGKSWPDWFAIIDRAKVAPLGHKGIVAYLAEHYPDVGGWWHQMLTVGYEQERGLREVHQLPEGYHASASRTVAVPVARLFAAWKDARARARWLPEKSLTLRKTTPEKALYITWPDGKSTVDVRFTAKGDGKSQVTVDHRKLANARHAARMRAYWSKALDDLRAALEK